MESQNQQFDGDFYGVQKIVVNKISKTITFEMISYHHAAQCCMMGAIAVIHLAIGEAARQNQSFTLSNEDHRLVVKLAEWFNEVTIARIHNVLAALQTNYGYSLHWEDE